MRKTFVVAFIMFVALIVDSSYASFGPGGWSLEGDSWGFPGNAGGALWSAASLTLNETPRPIIRISQQIRDPRTGEIREINIIPPPPRQRLRQENIAIQPVLTTGLSARVTNFEVASELLVMLSDLQTTQSIDLDAFLDKYELTLAKLLISMPFRYYLNGVTAFSGAEQWNVSYVKQQESVINMRGLDISIGFIDLDTFAVARSVEFSDQRVTLGARLKGLKGSRYFMGLHDLVDYVHENISGQGLGLDVAFFYHGTGESDVGLAIDDLYTRMEWTGIRQREGETVQDSEFVEVFVPTLRISYVARAGQSGAVYTEFVRKLQKNAKVEIRLGMERILSPGITGRVKIGISDLEGMVLGLGVGKKIGSMELDLSLSSSDFYRNSWGGGLSINYRF